MDKEFWKSWPGVATITGIGVAVAAGLAWAVSKASGTATPSGGGGVTPGAPAATQNYYLFTLTTPYLNTDAAGVAQGTAYAATLAALNQAGFAQVQLEEDPLSTTGWIGTGLWTAAGTPSSTTLPAGGYAFAALPVNNGSLASPSTTPGLTSLGLRPPTVATPCAIANLGNWYTFTVQTSFISGVAPATAIAMAAVQNVLGQMGWSSPTGSAGILVSGSSSNNQRWNVAAQWAGTGAVGTPGSVGYQAATSTTSQDRPPLLIFVPPVGSATTNPCPVDTGSTSTPTSVSSA
jgi:hypothetical protein